MASDKQDEAAEAVEELVESSRGEEGVLEYHASRDVEDASLFRFFEKYESPEDFESHTRTEHFGEFEE
ncbi:MAG: antibiotic biosynthesis monooxygenase, partial [Halobacteria archaeon]|nr:antibiotic biosynthesis monooxygenase [Halobacteria archaeon]